MDRPPDIVLLMAALIASVRTARFEEKEFRGMKSPRYQAAMAVSLAIAQSLYERATEESHSK